ILDPTAEPSKDSKPPEKEPEPPSTLEGKDKTDN
ncbi:unnamed protein product, partial [marine sediment metagenome]